MASFLERIIGLRNNPGTPVLTTRAVDTTYLPSASAYTRCVYTIQLQCTASQTSTVTLLCDTASPPTTARCVATLTIAALGVSTTVKQVLVWDAAPGENVRLATSGTGTAPVISAQFETPIS
jgi:hypothetical protein